MIHARHRRDLGRERAAAPSVVAPETRDLERNAFARGAVPAAKDLAHPAFADWCANRKRTQFLKFEGIQRFASWVDRFDRHSTAGGVELHVGPVCLTPRLTEVIPAVDRPGLA